MTLVSSPKDDFFLFHIINVKLVRERFELSIGIYVSTENTFFMKLASLKKMVKTRNCLAKKNKTKKN